MGRRTPDPVVENDDDDAGDGDEVEGTGDAPGIGDGGGVKPPVGSPDGGVAKQLADLAARVGLLENTVHDLLLHGGEMYVGAGEDRLALKQAIDANS